MKLLQPIATLLKGRWQIPLAIAAAITAGYAVYRLQPTPPTLDFAAVEEEIVALGHAEKWTDAIDAAANVLALHPELTPAQQAILNRHLAELLAAQERARPAPLRPNAELLLTHEEAARAAGAPVSAADELRVAEAEEWLDNGFAAVGVYRRVLALQPTAAETRTARQALVRLLDGRPEHAAERREHLLAALGEEGISPDYLWWGLQEAVTDVLDEGDTVAARRLLERFGGGLATSDLKGYLEYLTAVVLVHEGRAGEAAPIVDWIEDWLTTQAPSAAPLDERGYLPAMNRWLLGQLELQEMRPQSALTAFDEAMRLQPTGLLHIAALGGRGAALSLLERHTEALETLHAASEALCAGGAETRRATERLSRDLRKLFDAVRERGHREHALGYLELAAELADEDDLAAWIDLRTQLGTACNEAADHAQDTDQQHVWRAAAGAAFEQAAEKSVLDDVRFGELLWLAATAYDQAGRLPEAGRSLKRFIESRSSDPRLPVALLRLGQVRDAEGRLDEALRWYGQVTSTYPELQEAALAKLRAAECLAALGGAQEAEAERYLRELLEQGDIAPQAPVFHDALLRLCELFYDQGRFGEAISRLEDFLRLYPQDADHYVARFLLADAYRRSGAALRAEAGEGADGARRLEESRVRNRRAAELFAGLAADAAPASLPSEQAETYRRLALFYEADCLFEQDDAASLPEALAIYRQVGTRFEREPAALTAQVQMANIHLRLGQTVEAARAVERARWLLRNIPDAAFGAGDAGGERAQWERYLAAVSATPLLGGVLAAAP